MRASVRTAVWAVSAFASLQLGAIVHRARAADALAVDDVPNPRAHRSWVSDVAGVLTDAEEGPLDVVISDHERILGDEIAVVTVPAVSGDVKSFATDLFRRWGVGKRGRDNGVLVVLSIAQRRVEIETGYGVEDALPDAFVGDVAGVIMRPRFRVGDYGGGLLQGVRALIGRLNRAPTDEGARAPSRANAALLDATAEREQPFEVTWLLPWVLAAFGLAAASIALSDFLRAPVCLGGAGAKHPPRRRSLLYGTSRRDALPFAQSELDRKRLAHHHVARCRSCGSQVVTRAGALRFWLGKLLWPPSAVFAWFAMVAAEDWRSRSGSGSGSADYVSSLSSLDLNWPQFGSSDSSSGGSSGGFDSGGSSGGDSFGGGDSGGGGAGSSW